MSGETIGPALDELFARRGAAPATTPIILPAEPYLDTAGEALRRRIFLTRGEGGENLCLRPDFTVPVCMRHIAEGADLPRRYSYRGLVFRQRADGPAEFVQAGIEDLGEEHRAEADARAVADALAGLEACSVPAESLDVILGDQGLFEAVLRALGLPEGWQRRLIRTFGHDGQLRAALEGLSRGPDHALDGIEPQLVELARDREEGALTRLIRSRMEDAGLPPHSGRSPGEIAARLIEKVAVAEARLGEGPLELLQDFLAVSCPLDEAGERLAVVMGTAGLDLGRAMTAFETRNLALRAANVDLSRITYRAAFGRPIDYYTGLVFEAREKGADEPLAGGGRYDRLMTILGADTPIPAVGFSLWLDRIEGVAR
ncbi:ATP phosphoribosyltransferase regulatory subunit [Jiella avicenniae]|uniref:ATP phosphoribosyltransferase regulatory subunit n=1 Tax=Jiella avicenniae TaxID=2907202 RepID=A0A9X1NZ53_9HYPH|nr:ATP phosphoribosyltransferase regulatory subunit [Jiella avicenniae]MCE7027563.1 ATP phosphoribosyltransferase regulatory subunit [Jiella avicenniae]